MASTELTRAQKRARRLYRSLAHQNVYVQGARAALNTRPKGSNPYHRTRASGFHRAWQSGWLSVDANVDYE